MQKRSMQVHRATLEKLSGMLIAWACFHYSGDTPIELAQYHLLFLKHLRNGTQTI